MENEGLGKYASIGLEVGQLVETKQESYGDSFGRAGRVMRILYPDGIKPEQMDDALAVTRILDKLFRIANRKDAFGESPYRDIAGYGLLGAVRHEAERDEAAARGVETSQGGEDG